MRIYLFLLSGLLALNGFSQITVPQTTRSFYGIVEATWCGLCGQYGIPATNDIIAQTSPKAVYVSLHKSSTSLLYSQTGSDLATAFGTSGQPIFTLNAMNLGAHSSTIVSEVVTAIDNYYTPSGAVVNAGFEYGIVGDSLYVHTKTTFFQELTGEYYVGIYVYEDSIWEWQANYDPGIPDMDIWHNHVLRTSLNGHFGQLLTSGTIPSGTSFNKNAKIKLDPLWNIDQLHVFTIVWKKNGSAFDFVNANDAGTVITGHVGVEESAASPWTIYPNPATDFMFISGVDISSDTEITVFDLQGNRVLKTSGSSMLNVQNLAAGQYIVQVIHEGKMHQQKIFKAD